MKYTTNKLRANLFCRSIHSLLGIPAEVLVAWKLNTHHVRARIHNWIYLQEATSSHHSDFNISLFPAPYIYIHSILCVLVSIARSCFQSYVAISLIIHPLNSVKFTSHDWSRRSSASVLHAFLTVLPIQTECKRMQFENSHQKLHVGWVSLFLSSDY